MTDGVLTDTSVWVDHFRRCNEDLVSLLTLDLTLRWPSTSHSMRAVHAWWNRKPSHEKAAYGTHAS